MSRILFRATVLAYRVSEVAVCRTFTAMLTGTVTYPDPAKDSVSAGIRWP